MADSHSVPRGETCASNSTKAAEKNHLLQIEHLAYEVEAIGKLLNDMTEHDEPGDRVEVYLRSLQWLGDNLRRISFQLIDGVEEELAAKKAIRLGGQS